MASTPDQLTAAGLEFLRARHLATLTSLLPDGRPHVVPVGFTWDAEQAMARVITDAASRKARNCATGSPVALGQVDGRWWLTLTGIGHVSSDPDRVADAVRRYTERYRPPRVNPTRIVIEVSVTGLLGSPEYLGRIRSPRPLRE